MKISMDVGFTPASGKTFAEFFAICTVGSRLVVGVDALTFAAKPTKKQLRKLRNSCVKNTRKMAKLYNSRKAMEHLLNEHH